MAPICHHPMLWERLQPRSPCGSGLRLRIPITSKDLTNPILSKLPITHNDFFTINATPKNKKSSPSVHFSRPPPLLHSDDVHRTSRRSTVHGSGAKSSFRPRSASHPTAPKQQKSSKCFIFVNIWCYLPPPLGSRACQPITFGAFF
jgi:hypothetical protein